MMPLPDAPPTAARNVIKETTETFMVLNEYLDEEKNCEAECDVRGDTVKM